MRTSTPASVSGSIGMERVVLVDRSAYRRSSRAPSAARCALRLFAIKVSLATLGFARTLRWVRRSPRSPIAAPSARAQRQDELISATLDAVALASALWPGRALCLEQSLTLYYSLARAGVPVTFRLGLQPHPFQAHAWVEHEGRVLNDFEEHVRHYVALPELPR